MLPADGCVVHPLPGAIGGCLPVDTSRLTLRYKIEKREGRGLRGICRRFARGVFRVGTVEMNPGNKIALCVRNMRTDGHHHRYCAAISQMFAVERVSSWGAAVSSRLPLLVPTVESMFLSYSAIAVLRNLLGRRTVGLLFRPGPALAGTSLRLRLKRAILKLLLRLPLTRTLTILPFSVEPRFAEIADGWIYDLQLWDLDAQECRRVRERPDGEAMDGLRAAIGQAAAGRPVCCAIGRQNRDKGFDRFVDLYVSGPGLREAMLFAFGGQVDAGVAAGLPDFRRVGGYGLERELSDGELLDLYGAADLVWCAYDPSYDQASGILGRAAQLGIPVLVRDGSLVHRLCRLEGIAHVAVAFPPDAVCDWTRILAVPPRQTEAAIERTRRMAASSVRRLREALGFTG